MGCGLSRSSEGSFVNLCKEEGCLVSLCKQRKDLIGAARDCRYALSASHVLYLQSLLEFSEALDVFFKDAEVVSVESPSCSSVADSPLHSIEDSHLDLSSADSESVFLGSLTDEVHKGEKDGRSKLSSPRASVGSGENETEILMRENVSRMMRSPAEAITELLEPDVEYTPSMPSIYHHPDGFPQNDYWFPVDGTGTRSSGTTYTHYYNGNDFSDYGDWSAFSFPANSSVQGQSVGGYGSGQPMGYYRDTSHDYQPYAQPNPSPIPSPPMANSTMDYLDLFSFTDDFYSSYYSRNLYEDGLGTEYPDLNHLREDEGIPPLEEIVEDKPSEPFDVSKAAQETQLEATRRTSEENTVESNIGHMAGGKDCNQNGQGDEIHCVNTSVEKNNDVANTSILTDTVEKEAGSTDVGSSLGDGKIIDEGEPSSQLKQAIVPKRPVFDIFEAVQEINHSFLTAYNSGKEVTEILEAEKIPHLPTGSALKGFYRRILGAIAPSTVSLQTTYMLRKQSAHKILKMTSLGSDRMVKDNSHRHGMMTSTLDKLYMWEKKLYREVKIEENLRAVYDKLCKRSKRLVNKGAESDKIDAVQMKIKRLLPEINVSVSAVRVISKHIQHARDEELYPQVSGLIHGLSRMWKSMGQCHQNQVQVAADANDQNHANIVLHLDMKHTEDLKLKVLSWRSCLCDLITTQRALATLLTEWLSKFRLEEAEETKDGVAPFSPGRMGAPHIVLSCHDWLQALETTLVSRASEALKAFALTLHNLWAKQHEEKALRLRMEFIESWIKANSSHAESHPVGDNAKELDQAMKNLEELKAVHAGVFEQMKSVASSLLKDELVMVLGALESMCTDMSNAYDQMSLIASSI